MDHRLLYFSNCSSFLVKVFFSYFVSFYCCIVCVCVGEMMIIVVANHPSYLCISGSTGATSVTGIEPPIHPALMKRSPGITHRGWTLGLESVTGGTFGFSHLGKSDCIFLCGKNSQKISFDEVDSLWCSSVLFIKYFHFIFQTHYRFPSLPCWSYGWS